MAFPKRSIEWRQIKETYHFFIGTKSVCQRVTSNGEFNFATTKLDLAKEKVCKFCLKDAEVIKERVNEVI